MARPREFDRDEALAKARDAFWERGYEGTSMADLVSMLGIASARIYAAFGSKEDLFREAIGLYEAKEGGFVSRVLGEELAVYEAIRRILHDAVETYTRPGKALGCMVVTAATNCAAENSRLQDWLGERRRRQTAAIAERLERARHDGEFAEDVNVESLADYLTAIMHGLSVQARDGVPAERLTALCDLSLRTVSGFLKRAVN